MMRAKTWPGFASVVKDSQYTSEQVIKLLGITEDMLLDWYSSGAPIAAHLVIRSHRDLGMISGFFMGWSLEDKWLIAPNDRKISLNRLENIAKVQAENAIRLVR